MPSGDHDGRGAGEPPVRASPRPGVGRLLE